MATLSAEETTKPQETPEAKVDISKTPDELILPGLKIRIKERYVDVDSKICLTEGMLELIACTKDTKEHESLIVVEAKAAHIHAALLLIGAQPGNPAMRKQIDGPDSGWVDFPPRGQNIDVYLVFKNEAGELKEHPIKKFLIRSEDHMDYTEQEAEKIDKAERAFPTNTFLFAGSHVFKDGESEPVYLSDESGNVISLATFGDELLCLPGMHAHENSGLVWGVDDTDLPEIGKDVILRLKPQFKEAEATEEPKK